MPTKLLRNRVLAALACLLPLAAAAKDAAVPPELSEKALEMLKRSVAFKTVEGEGQVPAYAEYLARELEAHGLAKEDITITPRGETARMSCAVPAGWGAGAFASCTRTFFSACTLAATCFGGATSAGFAGSGGRWTTRSS